MVHEVSRRYFEEGVPLNDRRSLVEVAEANGHGAMAARLRALEAERARAAQTAAGSEPKLGEGLNQELLARLHRAHILDREGLKQELGASEALAELGWQLYDAKLYAKLYDASWRRRPTRTPQ